ncbi:hypothetical protein [Celeribacter indicus]|uniref:SRPBCC family protein n=1 Tax=Celeribacter indicus TaxID=1208324 RepID=A0A0B5DWB7_9RHOB|nr:hypothetical protein [Celeribacter indicus]AJE47339.1 hypothetical protein P73_2624 [Celeribacter indicus]SDW03909.1 hypothetical protein SAMN05443573_101181 [Celeribacter indicus]
MKPTAFLAILATTSLVAVPALAEPLDIAEVETTVTLDDVEANALDYWPEIGADLNALVSAGLIDQMEPNGDYSIRLDVTEMSLEGATVLGAEGEFNELDGWVYIYGPTETTEPVERLRIQLSAEEAYVEVPSNMTVVAPARAEFYNALVTAFAAKTVSEVAKQETQWFLDDDGRPVLEDSDSNDGDSDGGDD